MTFINREMDAILFGEVKWTGKPVGTDIYESLKQKASRVSWGTNTRKERYCLFSKTGFTDAMLKAARNDDVLLFQEGTLLT